MGVPFVEDLDPNDPGVRRINYAFVADDDPELKAHIERLRIREEEREDRLRRRVDVPSFRKPPRSKPLQTLSDRSFPLPPSCKYIFRLEHIETHATGIVFELVARTADDVESETIGRIDTGPRTGSVYLGIVLPDGAVVTNKKCHVRYAPEDSDERTPWLHGARSTRQENETRTTYFLSPLPDRDGSLTATISYQEIGIDTGSTVEIPYSAP